MQVAPFAFLGTLSLVLEQRVLPKPRRRLIAVPKGHLRIAQRFNVGTMFQNDLVPKGRLIELWLETRLDAQLSRPFRDWSFLGQGSQR